MTEERSEPCIDLDALEPTKLTPNSAKSLFSQGYLAMISSVAGAPVMMTGQDQDINAIDAQIDFLEGPIRVQLKCTSSLTATDEGLRFRLKKEWVRKWDRSKLPVYLLIVVLGSDSDWLKYEDAATVANAKAFWARVDKLPLDTTSILISPGDTVDNNTISTWFTESAEGGLA